MVLVYGNDMYDIPVHIACADAQCNVHSGESEVFGTVANQSHGLMVPMLRPKGRPVDNRIEAHDAPVLRCSERCSRVLMEVPRAVRCGECLGH